MSSKAEAALGLPAEVARAVKDEDRLAVLRGLEVIDSTIDVDFNRISNLAAAVMQAPIALVTLVDLERQWFKSWLWPRRNGNGDQNFLLRPRHRRR